MKKGEKKKIFIVEDDLPTVEVYTTAFEAAGFCVEVSNWGAEAIKRIKEEKEKPDLILLDLILPDINGIEVLEELKKEDLVKDIPVFILTNYTDKDLVKMGYKLDAAEFLTKTDYPPSRLLEIIKEKLK